MKFYIFLAFLLLFYKSSFAQEAKARDMAIDSTLILMDSVITLPIKQDVVILKQSEYLSPKSTKQSFEALEKSPISSQVSKRFTKYLKNKSFRKKSDLTDGEKFAIVGGIILLLGLSFLFFGNINSFKKANSRLFWGGIVFILSLSLLIASIKDRENKGYSRFGIVKSFQKFFDSIFYMFLTIYLSVGFVLAFTGLLFHVWILWNLAFSTAIIIGVSLLVLSIALFVGAYFIDR